MMKERMPEDVYLQEDAERIAGEEKSWTNMQFSMENLSIQLVDEEDKDFLFCVFERTKFNYVNAEDKMMTFSIR